MLILMLHNVIECRWNLFNFTFDKISNQMQLFTVTSFVYSLIE